MVYTRRMKDDPQFGVDSRWSWITAFFCVWVMFLTMATPRIAGIFFYGIIEAFGVTRAEALWPVSLAGTLTFLGGPIAGYLCHRLSCRAVLLACSSLAGLAVSLCYLAKSVLFITISLGIIHAYGSRWCLQAPILVRDFGITALPVTMGGVLFSGGVALLLRPLIIGYFRDTHGDYTGLLHLMAILNAFFVCVWTFKFIASTRTRNAATSQPARNQNLMSSSKHKNDFK